MPVNTNDLRDMASEFRETSFTAMVIEAANQLDSTRTERNILRAELTAAREELRESARRVERLEEALSRIQSEGVPAEVDDNPKPLALAVAQIMVLRMIAREALGATQ
jgi:BMFP domain-containing protein YqiC